MTLLQLIKIRLKVVSEYDQTFECAKKGAIAVCDFHIHCVDCYDNIQNDYFSTRLWANSRKSEFLFKICYLIFTLEITLSDLSDWNGVWLVGYVCEQFLYDHDCNPPNRTYSHKIHSKRRAA